MDDPTQRVALDECSSGRLRIAVVSDTYLPEVNGVATTIAQVVRGLRRRRHRVQLIRPRQGPSDHPDRDDRFDEVLTGSIRIPCYLDLRLGVVGKDALTSLWMAQRPDVVHIATEGLLGWTALNVAKRLNIPVSSDFRTNFHAYSAHYRMNWLHKPILTYMRKFHNRAMCTTVPTEALRRDLDAAGFRNLVVIARGVDTAQFQPDRRSDVLRATWGVAADDPVVVCVGRLAAEKNLRLLLDAFAAIRLDHPGARLLLVGDGPMRDELRSRYPDGIFTGQLAGDTLAAHYASADLFLFPSLTETFGNVTLEALASGLPVVAFGYAAAARFIVSGDNGVLVPYGDAEAFRRAATELAGRRALRRSMGLLARRTAESIAWDDVIARFEGVLHGLVEARSEEHAFEFEETAAETVRAG